MDFTFIHAADLHIDSPLAGLGCKDPVVAERFARAGRQAVENLIDETLRAKAAFLLICGDLYDRDWRDASTGLFFVRALGRLHREGVATFIVKGNHDAESQMSRSLPYPDSVRIFSAQTAHSFDIEDLNVVLHGRSFGSRAVDADFAATYPPRREGWLNIGLLHTALDGSRGHESYAPCSVEDLKRYGYDYWALGHVHAAEAVSREPWIVYPGNLQGRHVRETGPKGAMRVTVSKGRVAEVAHVPLDSARWANRLVDVSDCRNETQIMELVERAIGAEQTEAHGRPLALRLTLSGVTPLHGVLAARCEHLEADIRALAFRFAQDLWVERLKLATSPPKAAPLSGTAADALNVEALIHASCDAEFAQELAQLAVDIARKLPMDLRQKFAEELDSATSTATVRDLLLGEVALAERSG